MSMRPPLPARAMWRDGSVLAQQPVPSGQPVELFEVLVDSVSGEDWVRFRFLAPQIGKSAEDITFEQAVDDFEFLCSHFALPYITEYGLTADVVVITLLDRQVEFGATDPQATQFIETFRKTDNLCEPEGLW